MIPALVLAIACTCAGAGVIRVVGLKAGFGLAPSIGIAMFAILATGGMAVPLPPPLTGVLLLILAAAGAVLARRGVYISRTPAVLFAGIAVCIPLLLATTVFGSIGAPLSTHDGAFHVEAIDGLRHG